MAIRVPSSTETIKVICRQDSAIDVDPDTYNNYLKTLDESILTFVPEEEPTRFVMRLVLPTKLAYKVQNAQIDFRDGEAKIQSSYMSEEVRCALVGVENPASLDASEHIKYEPGNDGGASSKMMEGLIAAGITNDLFVAKQNAMSSLSASLKKK